MGRMAGMAGWELLGVQVYGGLAMVAWTVVVTFVLVKLIDYAMGARVPLKVRVGVK